jgi:hypothetical protein
MGDYLVFAGCAVPMSETLSACSVPALARSQCIQSTGTNARFTDDETASTLI